MATDEIPSEDYSFRNPYLRQPLFDSLSSSFATISDESTSFPPQEALLRTTFPIDSIEQQDCFNLSHIANSGVHRDSLWTQAPANDPQTDHSPFVYDISRAAQTPSSLEHSYSCPLSSYTTTGASTLETEPTMTLPVFYPHGTLAFNENMSYSAEPLLSHGMYPHYASISPLSASSTGEAAGLRSTGDGGYPKVVSPFGSPLPTNRAVASTAEDLNSEPYARLIFRALKSAPRHRMVLKEIYDWFERNTDKAKDPKSRGWQNSIRHNLSMNGAFRKEEQLTSLEDCKRNYVWVLEQSAIDAGEVQSTTRYRRPGAHKRVTKSDAAFHRQRSGAKGGRASKGKQYRHRRSGASSHPPLLAQNDGFDTETEIGPAKFEQKQTSHISPYLAGYTNMEHGLSLGQETFNIGNVAHTGASRACTIPPEPAFAQHSSPTPTLTPTSFTEPDNSDLEQIVGCTEYDGMGVLFCGGLAEHSHSDFKEPISMDWNQNAAYHRFGELDLNY